MMDENKIISFVNKKILSITVNEEFLDNCKSVQRVYDFFKKWDLSLDNLDIFDEISDHDLDYTISVVSEHADHGYQNYINDKDPLSQIITSNSFVDNLLELKRVKKKAKYI